MKRVMIVDSHRPVRDILTELLGTEPDLAVAATCADGPAAIRAAEQSRPDIVLIDPQLPTEDGVDVVRRLATMHPGARVLILTASPHDRLVARATAAGAHEVLSKSIPYPAILAAIRAAHPPPGAGPDASPTPPPRDRYGPQC
jgi:DNA-binding NarL/FixJ family response regulator